MHRFPVESSAIVSVGYDAALETLEIEYVGGRVYDYRCVPLEEFISLMSSKSLGSFVNTRIKPVYMDFVEIP